VEDGRKEQKNKAAKTGNLLFEKAALLPLNFRHPFLDPRDLERLLSPVDDGNNAWPPKSGILVSQYRPLSTAQPECRF
jgi:hypothetical protein